MKNFFKKLSFVLAVAMVLTTLTPATASAASKNFIRLNGSSKAITSVTAWIGGVTRNLDYSINGKTSGVKGTWKSSNTSIVKVNKNTGVLTPVANGTAKVTFTASTGTTASVTVKVRTRAAALYVYDAAEYAAGTKTKLNDGTVELKVGETKDLKVTMPISKAATAAGGKAATYFSYGSSSDDSVVAVTKNSGERSYTLTAKAAGEATVTIVANQTTEANVRNNKYFKEATVTVKVAEDASASVKATGAQQLTVDFGTVVDTSKVTLKLTKGTVTVNLDSAAFSTDGKSYVFNTTGKLTKGTYTVTISGLAEEDITTSVDVEDEYVAKIELLDDGKSVAVNSDGDELYTYYDVYNQYGESVRSTASVTWSSSANKITGNAATGKLTLKTASGSSFTYGTSVYVVGTYTKGTNVASVTGTVLVGLEAKADSVEFKGIAKVSTGTLTSLPVDFKSNTYALLFKVYDQYGYEMDSMTDANKLKDSFSFSSMAPLVVAAPSADSDIIDGGVTVDGEVYSAVYLTPGNYAYKGGSAAFSVISSKTGKISNYTISLGDAQILTTFTLGTPSDIIAEGEVAVIPFTALDQNGEAITSFRTLAGQVTLTGVTMYETDDGSAYLLYFDNTTTATETTDIPVVLTSVVAGTADYSSVTLYIKDKAVPTTVSSLGSYVGSYITESDSIELGVSNYYYGLQYQDQYGRNIGVTNAKTGVSKKVNSYFENGTYAVKATYTGTAFDVTGGAYSTKKGNTQTVIFTDASPVAITAVSGAAATTVAGSIKFTIVENSGDYDEVTGNAKAITFTNVDMSQFVSYSVTTNYSSSSTLNAATDSAASVQVYGTLSNGSSASIPSDFWDITIKTSSATNYKELLVVSTSAVDIVVSQSAIDYAEAGDASTNSAIGSVFYDYSALQSNGTYKQIEVAAPFVVTIKDPEQQNAVVGTVSATQNLSIATDVVTSITTASSVVDGAATISATEGVITQAELLAYIASYSTPYKTTRNYDTDGDSVLDYFTEDNEITIDISSLAESENGFQEGMTVSTNNAATVQLEKMEIGDTFVATFSKGYASVSVTFTVGADTAASSTGTVPTYR